MPRSFLFIVMYKVAMGGESCGLTRDMSLPGDLSYVRYKLIK